MLRLYIQGLWEDGFKHLGYFGLSMTRVCSFGPTDHIRTISDNSDHLRPAWNCLRLSGTLCDFLSLFVGLSRTAWDPLALSVALLD